MANQSSNLNQEGSLRMSDLDALDDLRYQDEMDREVGQRRRPFNYTANIESILQGFL